ncbi:MAG: 3'-5' exonuclease [Porphyromonas sp.]|nr:3'-5' exonuclease [Porphyromonas sp.]
MRARITKEEIGQLPLAVHLNPIHLIDTPKAEKEAIEYLKQHHIVGFDTETRPSFTRGVVYDVALLQFATMEQTFLFRVNKLGFSKLMQQLLLDADVLKVGLSVKDDYNAIVRKTKLHPEGFVDLQKLYPAYGVYDAALQKLYAIVFGEKISKSQQLSNWEAKELTPEQQHYAALDAYACLRLYNYLLELPLPNLIEFGLICPL